MSFVTVISCSKIHRSHQNWKYHSSSLHRYGYVLTGQEIFGLSLHLIDLRGVPEDEIQLCIQCNCKYLNSNINNVNNTNSWYTKLSFNGINKHTDWLSGNVEHDGTACCSGNKMCYSNLDKKDTRQYYFRYSWYVTILRMS